MTSIQPRAFFDPALLPREDAIDRLTPTELYQLEANLDPNRNVPKETQELAKAYGEFGTGMVSSFVGKVGAQIAYGAINLFESDSDKAFQTPLYVGEKTQNPLNPATPFVDSIGEYQTYNKNNIESIADDLASIPSNEWAYVLQASSYGDYKNRLDMVRTATPEFAQMGSFGGAAAGFTADLSAIVMMSLALEPLAFKGVEGTLLARGAAIGKEAAVPYFGSLVNVSTQAVEAASTISTLSNMGRYAALGIAEEAVIKIAREGIDPTYSPDAPSIVVDSIFAAAIGGSLGGFAGRAYVNDLVESHAQQTLHVIRTGRDKGVIFRSFMPFGSTSAADLALLGTHAKSLDGTLDNLSAEAFQSYSTTGRELIPSSEFTPLPLLQEAGTINRAEDLGVAMLSGNMGRSAFVPGSIGTTGYSPASADMVRLLVMSGRPTGLKAALAGEVDEISPKSFVLINRRGGLGAKALRRRQAAVRPEDAATTKDTLRKFDRKLATEAQDARTVGEAKPLSKDTGIDVEFDTRRMEGDLTDATTQFAAAEKGDVAFRYMGNWRGLRRSVRNVRITKDADPNEAARVRDLLGSRKWKKTVLADGSEVYTPPGASRFVPANAKFKIATQGIQSNILAVVAEIQRRGGEVNEDTAKQIGRLLFEAHQSGLRGASLTSKVMSHLEKTVDPKVFARIKEAQRLGNGFQLSNLANDFDELTQRKQFIDGLFELFEQGEEAASGLRANAGSANSLILQVANEIRRRGGNLTREDFDGLVDELRNLSQNPPMKKSAKGADIIDLKQRTANLATLINKRVPLKGQRIHVPRELSSSFKRTAEAAKAGSIVSSGTGGGGVGLRASKGSGGTSTPTPKGTAAAMHDMQAQVPQATGIDTLGMLQRVLNQAAYVMTSNNPVVRMFGMTAFNYRRVLETPNGEQVAQGQTIFELGTYQLAGILGRTLISYRNGYTRFALNKSVNDKIGLMDGLKAGFGAGKKETKRQFHREVSRQIRSGKFDSPNEVVNETAREMRKVLNDAHKLGSEAGLRGFQQGAVLNYFPRMWRFHQIDRLASTSEGKAAFRELIKKSLSKDGATRQLLMEDGSIRDLTDIDQAATVLTERLISLARNSDTAPMLDIDNELAQALETLEDSLKPAGSSKTPFGRPRIILDEEASISVGRDFLNSGSNELSLADLLADDLPLVMKRYTTSIMGAINERRLLDEMHAQLVHFGVTGPNGNPLEAFNNFEELFGLMNKIGTEVPGMGGQVDEATMSSMRELVAAIRYEPLHRSSRELGDIGRLADKVLGVLLPLGYMSTGGAFGLAAMTETSRIVGTLGMKTTAKQIPIVGEMVNNWKNMDEDVDNLSSFVDQAFHPSGDRLRRILFYDIEAQVTGREMGSVSRALNSASNLFSDITLLSPITSFTQHLAAAATLQHMYEASVGATKFLDDATVRTLGLEPEQYRAVVDWVGKNAVLKNGSDRVVSLNNLNALEMDNLRVFIDRMVRTRIQDIPTRGDFAKGMFSSVGRLMSQFRTFNLKGVDNFMLQNISRARRGGGASVAKEIAFTTILAGMIQYSRQYMNYKSAQTTGNYEEADRIAKDHLGLQGFLRGGVTGPSELFLPMLATDAVWANTVSDDPLFSAYRYSGLNWYGFPALSMFSKISDISKDVYGATVARAIGAEEKEREITTGTIHKGRMLIPLNNMPGFKQFFDISEAEIAQEFNLAKRQRRKPRAD